MTATPISWPHAGADGRPKATRENGMHAFKLAPLRGLLGFDELANEVHSMRVTPWGSGPAVWSEYDDIRFAEYLVHTYGFSGSLGADVLAQIVKVIAADNPFHPIRDWLRNLRWDGVERLDGWLFKALRLDIDGMPPERTAYLERVGLWFLCAMVKRAFAPGCKHDYMLVLEGPQGYGKSTLGRVLAGDYFSDTHLDLGNKDSYLQLRGRWVHEFSEMHSLATREVSLVKAFLSAAVDYFRAPFDRRPAAYPRQCVFFGTSNGGKWARDRTGNRRFWPVEVTQPIDLDWLIENREQLFAEAVVRVDAGQRCYPTQSEEINWFRPEQAQRVQATAVEEALYQYLCGERNAKGSADLSPPQSVSLVQCLENIGIDVAKSASNRMVQSEVIELLHKWGWRQARASKTSEGKRPWVYVRPTQWPPKDVDAAIDHGDATQPTDPAQQAGQPETNDDVPFC